MAAADHDRLVQAAFTLADLLGGESEAIEWAAKTRGEAAGALPEYLSSDSRSLALEELEQAGAVSCGKLDADGLARIVDVLVLAPVMRAAEDARRPAPRSRLVCTVPPSVSLPAPMRHVQRSLSMLVADCLRSPGERVLLAAPYWSRTGTDHLRDALGRACDQGTPITLAGARHRDGRHFEAMLAFAHQLRADGASVTALAFNPPKPQSLFHAKVVLGKRGYLGTSNLTVGGLEENVELGLPLDETDVERVWWLIDQLVQAALLCPHG